MPWPVPLALIGAVTSYYLVGAVIGSENPDGSADQIVRWSVVALGAGAGLGVVGAAVRSRTPSDWLPRSSFRLVPHWR